MAQRQRGLRQLDDEDPISRTKTLCRRMAQQGWRITVIDAQVTAM
jgi:hypothetical protein